MSDWITFWNSKHSIYVNVRHREVHCRTIADDIRKYVSSPSAAVLDYGCGEALHAERVAEACGRLILVDAASNVRAELTGRFKGDKKIEVRAPEQATALASRSVDLIVMNSVTQYLTAQELEVLLAQFRHLMKPDGLLIIGDVMPPHIGAVTDAFALLRFAAANQFLGAALIGLVRTFLSDYWRLRSMIGLSRYSEAEMTAKLNHAGFAARRAAVNMGHNAARLTFIARPS